MRPSLRVTRRHLSGELDRKTRLEFTAEQKRVIAAVQPQNLVHNSVVQRDKINGLSLPSGRDTIYACRVEELKAMVIARGGSLPGRDNKALRRMNSGAS